MYSEDDLIPISALQHFIFCKRQCALIHVEQLWSENIFTAEGRIMHDKVDKEMSTESRGGLRVARKVRMRSLVLGVTGIADVVEFHRENKNEVNTGTSASTSRLTKLKGCSGWWRPFPVEYKRGKPKPGNCDKVQLCAQAICLEEMLKVNVLEGAIYYGKTNRRLDVRFDDKLRNETIGTAKKTRKLIESGITPAAIYDKRCEKCSMKGLCLPKALDNRKKIADYLEVACR